MQFGLSDKGLRRIAQSFSKAEFLQGDLSGWFVHAADQPLAERNTGYITLFVEGERYIDVSHYGDFYTFVKPSSPIPITNIEDEIIEDLQRDYENGYLPGDLEGFLDASDWKSDISELLNPDNIVESAGWWDNPDFTSWFAEKYPYNFVVTYDGAVLFNLDEFDGDLVVITQEQMDEVWDI